MKYLILLLFTLMPCQSINPFDNEKLGVEALNVQKQRHYARPMRWLKDRRATFITRDLVPGLVGLSELQIKVEILNGSAKTRAIPLEILKQNDINAKRITELAEKRLRSYGLKPIRGGKSFKQLPPTLTFHVKLAMSTQNKLFGYVWLNFIRYDMKKGKTQPLSVWSLGHRFVPDAWPVVEAGNSYGGLVDILDWFITYYISSNPQLIPKYTMLDDIPAKKAIKNQQENRYNVTTHALHARG